MTSISSLRGSVVQTEVPMWSPLERVLGAALVGWFMWMHEIRLEDGTRLDAYKHIITRRYLHLTRNCTAYAPLVDSAYRPMGLLVAVEGVFEGWEKASPPVDQLLLLRSVVEGIHQCAA